MKAECDEKQKEKDLKQFGINRYIINSIALFIFFENYEKEPSVVDVFNSWAVKNNIKIEDMETLSLLLEHIRRLINTNRGDLEKALQMDGFITRYPN